MNDKEMILRVRILVNEDNQKECSLACPQLKKMGSHTYLCTVFGILTTFQYPNNLISSMALRNNCCVKNSTDL